MLPVPAAPTSTAVAAEQNERVVLIGDLNGTVDDRAFDRIAERLRASSNAT